MTSPSPRRRLPGSREQRPTFTIRFVALPGIAPVPALRRLLKHALRRLGLRAVDAHEDRRPT